VGDAGNLARGGARLASNLLNGFNHPSVKSAAAGWQDREFASDASRLPILTFNYVLGLYSQNQFATLYTN
jgi:hypothetical protein